MKKIFTIIFALALLCLTLTSCDVINGLLGGNDGGDDDAGITAADLESVVFEDTTVTYDGGEKSIFATNVPEGVEVVYEGNGKINAGEYTVMAKFYYGDELLETKSAKLTVKKATFDASAVSFNGKTVTYDGTAHSIELTGTLPYGISVSYDGNGKTNVGNYTVTARFEYNAQNYEAISDMSATLVIKKAVYDMSDVIFSDKTVTYSREEYGIEISGKLPDGVSVSYTGNGKISAGSYQVVASFVGDIENYEPIPDMSATLTIEPFTVSGISFNDMAFDYDGEEKSIFVTGTVPTDVKVIYEGNGKTDVGSYVVTVRFETENESYGEFPILSATLTINKGTYVPVFNNATVSFDAKAHSIFVEGDIPEGISVTYVGNEVTIPGTYTVTAVFTTDGRYNDIANVSATIVIELGTYESPASDFEYSTRADGTLQITGYLGTDIAIVIPKNILGTKVTSIATEAFKNNEIITYVYISDEITNIGNSAFAFSSIEVVRFGNNIKVIGASAFKGTDIKTAELPATLTAIGSGAFANTPLESITLSFIGGSHTSSNSFLGYVFGASNYAGNEANVPATLESVTLNSACTEIPAYAFWGCSGIKEIIIGSAVATIGNSAFSGCSSLRSIYIPASVTDITANANAYDSPFYNASRDMLVVFESADISNFVQYALYINDAKKAITVYGKSYSDYLANKDGSYREFDATDSKLLEIQVNGKSVSGFSSSKLEYSVTLPLTSGIKIGYTASSFGASVEYTAPTASNRNVAIIKVTSADGNSVSEYKINFTFTGNTTAEIVNKDGADATVTFVIDDGEKQTATFAKSMLQKYAELALSFAVKTKDLATLKTLDTDGDGIPEYVIVDGEYQYDVNQSNVDFWNDVLSAGTSEIVSHTHTHIFWGLDDEGGYYTYVDNQGNIKTSALMPEGNSTKELYASKQILEDLFSDYISKNGTAISLIDAGIGVKTGNVVIDGVTYPTYKVFFAALWNSAYETGDLISVRTTFGSTYDPNLDLSTKVVTPSRYDTKTERFNTPGYMVEHYNANPEGIKSDDISNWKAYIDAAIAMNGWAGFCIHDIRPSSATSSPNGHFITEEQAEALFAYAAGKNIWVATYTAASMYYAEWSTATVSSVYENGTVKVTLTDKEDNEIFTEALTVKVSVPATWTSAIAGSEILEVHRNSDGSAYVYVNIVPDTGVVTISAN